MDTEYVMKVAARMQDAAERAEHAAGRMEDAAHRITILLEDGYGGNGVRLLEALEQLKINSAPQ